MVKENQMGKKSNRKILKEKIGKNEKKGKLGGKKLKAVEGRVPSGCFIATFLSTLPSPAACSIPGHWEDAPAPSCHLPKMSCGSWE